MDKLQVERRRQAFFEFSSQLAQIDQSHMQALLDEREYEPGWGRNHVITVAGNNIFVKRVPVTDLEMAQPFSTRNHYDLPLYYNYGVGSAGFGVFRELVMHIKTTNWVLSGVMPSFPLLYHYRIVPITNARHDIDMTQHQTYVRYWNSNANISQFIQDRAAAKYEVILFLEYLPNTLVNWLADYPERVSSVLAKLRRVIHFLKRQGIIHFDLNFYNILTDGADLYLTDFGLCLDRQFDFSRAERAFFETHLPYYDEAAFLAGLPIVLRIYVDRLSDEQKAKLRQRLHLDSNADVQTMLPKLIEQIEMIVAERWLSLPRRYVSVLVQYRDLILRMRQFFVAMRQNDKKDTPFPHRAVKRLLGKSV